METAIHEGSYDWGQESHPSQGWGSGPWRFGPFLLGGNQPVYNLSLIEVARQGVYLTFDRNALLAKGAVYRIVRPLPDHDDPIVSSGQLRRVVAEVEIDEVREAGRAHVRVIWGSVKRGVAAERANGGSI